MKAYTPLLEPLGLTYPQYLVMVALWEKDGQQVNQLAARLTNRWLTPSRLAPSSRRSRAASP